MASVKSTTTLPLAGMERILKKAGANRISDNAKKKMIEVLEEYGLELSKQAVELSKHAKRKTINEKDIALAAKSIK